MHHSRPLTIAFAIAIGAVVYCSDSAAAGTTVAGSACDDKLIAPADASGILSAPIVAMKPLAGDPQTCQLASADADSGGPHIEVSLRPGLGKVTVETWAAGKMPLSAAPLAGVGDGAVWVADTHEVDAQKNDVLCTVSEGGPAPALAADPAALAKRLGDLCNTIFSRMK
jgi:hypothetical protein